MVSYVKNLFYLNKLKYYHIAVITNIIPKNLVMNDNMNDNVNKDDKVNEYDL